MFYGILFAEILLGGALLVSWWDSRYRVWPPPSRNSWQFWFTWILIVLITAGIVLLGFRYGQPARRITSPVGIVGILAIAVGLVIALAGIFRLGSHQSTGLKGQLVTGGIYQYTRNPQYVGDVLILIGWSFIAGTGTVWLTAGLAILWFLLAPFVEEPWLEKQFGEEYEQYCEEVPRFM